MKKILLLALATIVLMIFNMIYGSVDIPLSQIITIVSGGEPMRPSWGYIIIESRFPQMITALLSGASLAVSGLMLQTAFRNPLADPSIFGISSGAGLGAAWVLLSFGGGIAAGAISLRGFAAVFVGAFIGAMIVMCIIFAFSMIVKSDVMLLIIGIMIGYIASSAITILNFFATQEGVKSYIVWGMGSFGGVSLSLLPMFSAVCLLCLASALLLIKPLNILLLGKSYAENLGVRTVTVRNWLLIITGALTSIVTAYCGPVSFIGLAVPHIARMIIKSSDHRILMPATMLAGSVTALLCNALCTLPGDGGIIPLNAITPIIGAPVIIYIILKKH